MEALSGFNSGPPKTLHWALDPSKRGCGPPKRVTNQALACQMGTGWPLFWLSTAPTPDTNPRIPFLFIPNRDIQFPHAARTNWPGLKKQNKTKTRKQISGLLAEELAWQELGHCHQYGISLWIYTLNLRSCHLELWRSARKIWDASIFLWMWKSAPPNTMKNKSKNKKPGTRVSPSDKGMLLFAFSNRASRAHEMYPVLYRDSFISCSQQRGALESEI